VAPSSGHDFSSGISIGNKLKFTMYLGRVFGIYLCEEKVRNKKKMGRTSTVSKVDMEQVEYDA